MCQRHLNLCTASFSAEQWADLWCNVLWSAVTSCDQLWSAEPGWRSVLDHCVHFALLKTQRTVKKPEYNQFNSPWPISYREPCKMTTSMWSIESFYLASQACLSHILTVDRNLTLERLDRWLAWLVIRQCQWPVLTTNISVKDCDHITVWYRPHFWRAAEKAIIALGDTVETEWLTEKAPGEGSGCLKQLQDRLQLRDRHWRQVTRGESFMQSKALLAIASVLPG